MEFYDITEEETPHPGEMLLYSPRNTIVVCAAIVDDKVRAFERGSYLEDSITEFKKIKITHKEHKKKSRSKCKGCSGGRRVTSDSAGISITDKPNTSAATGCKGCGSKK